jgi:hypothetical protein
MENIKTYKQFLNEEYGFKSIVGGLLFTIMSVLPNLSKASNNDTITTTNVYSPTKQIDLLNIKEFKPSVRSIYHILKNLEKKIQSSNSWDTDNGSISELITKTDTLYDRFDRKQNIDNELKEVTYLLSNVVENYQDTLSPDAYTVINKLNKTNIEDYDSKLLLTDYAVLYNEAKLIANKYDLSDSQDMPRGIKILLIILASILAIMILLLILVNLFA